VKAAACCLCALLWLGAPPAALAQAARMAGEPAAQAYRAGDYARAAALWQESLEAAERDPAQALRRADLLFNLGNAAYRRGSPLEAVGWYEACLGLEPRRSDARANLALARAKANLPGDDASDLTDTLAQLARRWTRAESAWAVLASCAISAALIAAWALRGGALLRRCTAASLGLTVLAAVPFLAHLARSHDQRWFVRSASGALLHSEPRRDSADVAKAEPGARVRVLEALGEWLKVEAPVGTRGWLERAQVMPIDPPFAAEGGAP
jgi:tetratricopeptide (TPR) repeat protein